MEIWMAVIVVGSVVLLYKKFSKRAFYIDVPTIEVVFVESTPFNYDAFKNHLEFEGRQSLLLAYTGQTGVKRFHVSSEGCGMIRFYFEVMNDDIQKVLEAIQYCKLQRCITCDNQIDPLCAPQTPIWFYARSTKMMCFLITAGFDIPFFIHQMVKPQLSITTTTPKQVTDKDLTDDGDVAAVLYALRNGGGAFLSSGEQKEVNPLDNYNVACYLGEKFSMESAQGSKPDAGLYNCIFVQAMFMHEMRSFLKQTLQNYLPFCVISSILEYTFMSWIDAKIMLTK